jgi:hypothetical protein
MNWLIMALYFKIALSIGKQLAMQGCYGGRHNDSGEVQVGGCPGLIEGRQVRFVTRFHHGKYCGVLLEWNGW